MFNPENWNWAVWLYVALLAFVLVGSVFMHGTPRPARPYDFPASLVSVSLVAALLYFGGFFK